MSIIDKIRSLGSVKKTSDAPSAGSTEIGMTRADLAKRLGAIVLVASAAVTPGAAIAGCIGEPFTVGEPDSTGTGGKIATSGTSGTGGLENVGGGSTTGGKGGVENTGGTGGAGAGTGGTLNVGGGGAGTGGVENTGGTGTGGTLNVGGGGADAGTGGVENTGGAGAGGNLNVGGGGAGGCQDIAVTIKGSTGEYDVKQYEQSCVPNGVDTMGGSFLMSTDQELCVKPGGEFLVQVKNAGNQNAVEFSATQVPSKVRSFGFGVNTSITDAEADAYCNGSTGTLLNPVTADQDPAVNNFKYVPTTPTQTNGFVVKF